MYKSIALGLISLSLASTVPAAAIERFDVENPFRPLLVSQLVSPLEEGRSRYEAGQLTEAVALWQQAAQIYEAKGDRANQALSLSYLSLAYQDLNRWDAARQAIEESLALLQGNSTEAILLAQAWNTKASLLLGTGQSQAALEAWEQAQTLYDRAGDTAGSLGSQMNQARALQSLGFYRRSQKKLQAIAQQLAALPDSSLKASGLRSVGVALQVSGNLKSSQTALEQSLKISQQAGAIAEVHQTLLALGNLSLDLGLPEQALAYFQQAEQTASSTGERQAAQLNQLNLYVKQQQWQKAQAIAPQLQRQLTQQPPSRQAIHNTVNFADRSLAIARQGRPIDRPGLNQLLARSVRSAKALKDSRAEALALEKWGQLYAENGQPTEAADLARQSLAIAQGLQADDIIARAAWQLGRLQVQQGQREAAIATYTQAVSALKSLRGDLVAINPDLQFSFRESVEPIYRELVALLLPSLDRGAEVSQQNLEQARALMEDLQLAELDNFFREACLDAQSVQIDRIDAQATALYPILLRDRLAVIVSSPDQPLHYYTSPRSQAEVEKTLKTFITYLSPAYDNEERLQLSQQIYDWLIRPAQADGALEGTDTLVFVLDGVLRNTPMAALHDGQNYLIEQYNLALSPGLQLLETKKVEKEQMNLIVGGVSEARQGFSSLPAVKNEVTRIAQQFSASVLLDRDFTKQTLAAQISANAASVVHLATHGQFSSKAEDTFLLAWDDRLNVQEFDDLLQDRQLTGVDAIELLVLSACETAAGDDRAVLGLAGIAVKSGARSTLATLWQVRDESTALFMTEFYQQFQKPGITKAEAVRQAQLAILAHPDYSEPFFWAPFILVGNWL